MYIYSIANYKYLFSYLKYKAEYVSETWLIIVNKNIRSKGLVAPKYIFSYSKYESQRIL